MWYLIIPPIIVVLILVFLLWYLSRKGSDPALQAKVEGMSQEPEPQKFSRTRSFFLRRLERMTAWFKVRTLRMHNTFDGLSQKIRHRRQNVAEPKPAEPVASEVPEPVAEPAVIVSPEPAASVVEPSGPASTDAPKHRRFLRFWNKNQAEAAPTPPAPTPPVSPTLSNTDLADPIVRRRKADDEELPVRPMVSETVARPEVVRGKKPKAELSPEEALIARIAANPKDHSAYETLGDYYMETGNIKDAKECYRQVLKLSPVHRMVKIKIRRLEKLVEKGAGK